MLIYNDQKDFTVKENKKVYETIIPDDNFFRKLNNLVDFTFVYEPLKDKYETTKEKTSLEIIRLFKYLLLKSYYNLSDDILIEKTESDMIFRYFLEYDLLDTNYMDASLITAFRSEKLTNEKGNLLERIIDIIETIANERGLSNIVDYTNLPNDLTIEDASKLFLTNMREIIE